MLEDVAGSSAFALLLTFNMEQLNTGVPSVVVKQGAVSNLQQIHSLSD